MRTDDHPTGRTHARNVKNTRFDAGTKKRETLLSPIHLTNTLIGVSASKPQRYLTDNTLLAEGRDPRSYGVAVGPPQGYFPDSHYPLDPQAQGPRAPVGNGSLGRRPDSSCHPGQGKSQAKRRSLGEDENRLGHETKTSRPNYAQTLTDQYHQGTTWSSQVVKGTGGIRERARLISRLVNPKPYRQLHVCKLCAHAVDHVRSGH